MFFRRKPPSEVASSSFMAAARPALDVQLRHLTPDSLSSWMRPQVRLRYKVALPAEPNEPEIYTMPLLVPNPADSGTVQDHYCAGYRTFWSVLLVKPAVPLPGSDVRQGRGFGGSSMPTLSQVTRWSSVAYISCLPSVSQPLLFRLLFLKITAEAGRPRLTMPLEAYLRLGARKSFGPIATTSVTRKSSFCGTATVRKQDAPTME